MPTITEFDYQVALYREFLKRGHWLFARNLFLYYFGANELDFISVNKSNFTVEIEVKLNYQDFKNDFKKTKKHIALEQRSEDDIPNYFYYALPPGIVDPEEVPSYAGWLEIFEIKSQNRRVVHQVRRAPKLHSNPMSDQVFRRISVSNAHRAFSK